MNADEEARSLAEQAAAWVPPWARQPETVEVAEPEPEEESVEERAAAVEPEPGLVEVEPALAVEVEPEPELLEMEPAVAVEVEPEPELVEVEPALTGTGEAEAEPGAAAEVVADPEADAAAVVVQEREPEREAEADAAAVVVAEPEPEADAAAVVVEEREPEREAGADAAAVVVAEPEPEADAAAAVIDEPAVAVPVAGEGALSFAEKAAAWVPPWARPPETVEVAEPEPEPVAEPETELVAEAEPATAEPEAAEPAAAESEAAESEAVEPEAAEPEATEPGTTEPEAAEPEAVVVEEPADAGTPEAEAEPAAEVEPIDLHGPLEAILLVVDEPVSEIMLAQVLEQPTERVMTALSELAEEYAQGARGFELRRAAGGWRLYTRGEYASYVERFVLDGQQVRLTQAALETLAVIAYKQPVTRSRISAIRGVNCDGVVRTLMSRGLVEECGSEPESGAFLYRTTTLFLEKLGLDRLEQLPPLAPFLPDDVDEIADAQR
jgi:segregation and condensation protein B